MQLSVEPRAVPQDIPEAEAMIVAASEIPGGITAIDQVLDAPAALHSE